MRISDWSSDVCSADLVALVRVCPLPREPCLVRAAFALLAEFAGTCAQQIAARDDADQRARLRIDDADAAHVFRDHQVGDVGRGRSEEHTSELQSLMRISYAVFCLKKKTTTTLKA